MSTVTLVPFIILPLVMIVIKYTYLHTFSTYNTVDIQYLKKLMHNQIFRVDMN